MGIGPNKKAQEGRERKAAQKELQKKEEQKKRAEVEAKEWEQGAKTKSRKQIQDDEKRVEKAQKKLEKERIEAAEAAELAALKPVKPLPKDKTKESPKASVMSVKESVTRAEKSSLLKTASSPYLSTDSNDPVYSASNIEDALFLLEATGSSSSLSKLERHPERRVKAAYAAYEERELPRLKAEYPGLRLAQLREKLYRQWLKAPENPFNQSHIVYNATKSQEWLQTEGELEVSLERLKLPPS